MCHKAIFTNSLDKPKVEFSVRIYIMNNKVAKNTLWFLLVTSIVIVILHTLLNFISIVIFDQKHGFIFELANRFDLNDETSVPQWITQALFLAISFMAFLAYRLTTRKEGSRLWLLITGLGLLMSIDDVATIHEFVLESLHNTFFVDKESTVLTNAWLLLLPFILIGLILLCRWAIKVLPRKTAVTFVIGGVTYVFGAVIIDSLANQYPVDSFTAQGIMGGIEGGLQLIGSSVLLYAIIDYLETYYRKPIRTALDNIKPIKRSKA